MLDWNVPQEWNIHDAYIKDSAGNRVVDFARHNLHVLSYSTPVHARLVFSSDTMSSLSTRARKLCFVPRHGLL